MEVTVRIALVHPKFDGSGGAERYAAGLASSLAERGHEVHLFGRRAARLPAGLRFHRVLSLPFGRVMKTWAFDALAGGRIRGSEFAVVQGFGKTHFQTVHRAGGGVHRAYLERHREKGSTYDRVVIRIEDRLFSSPRLRAVIAPSHWVRHELERFYPGVASRIHVIPNGVDTSTFHPEGRGSDRARLAERISIPEGAAVLLFVATNFALKGLDTAIAATTEIPGARLVVAGDDDPAPFQAAAAAAGVGDRVRFLGRVDGLGDLYRASDLLLHPTRYDPFANVCLEAMACGTPVVTTDRNGAADLLARGGGEVVPAEAGAAQVAAAARRILSQGAAAGNRAREIAEECDRKRHVEAVEALYRATGELPWGTA
jgi:UDP-glucose:(heptosyl)LPS alpha-1,3-glucosyltransferase